MNHNINNHASGFCECLHCMIQKQLSNCQLLSCAGSNIYMHIHTHARTHARTHTHTHTHTHSLTHTYTHTHAHTHIHNTVIHIHTCTDAYAPTHMHTHNLHPQLHTNIQFSWMIQLCAHTAESSNPQINQPQEKHLNLTQQGKQISLRVLLSSFLLGSVLAPFFCACPRCTMLLLAAGG